MNCRCHGEPQYWVKDSRYKLGGYWRCAVDARARAKQIYARTWEQVCLKRVERWHSQTDLQRLEANHRRHLSRIRQRKRERASRREGS